MSLKFFVMTSLFITSTDTYAQETLLVASLINGEPREFEIQTVDSEHTESNIYRVHEDKTILVAFSPNGRKTVSGSCDGTIAVFNPINGEQLFVHKGRERYPTALAISPDGEKIVSGLSNGTIIVWDARHGEQLYRSNDDKCRITSIAFSHDGLKFATAAEGGNVTVRDATNGNQLRLLRTLRRSRAGDPLAFTSLAFTHDDIKLAAGSRDGKAIVWDLGGREEPKKFDIFYGFMNSSINSLAFSQEGKKLVAGSRNTRAKVIDIDSGQEERILSCMGPVLALAWVGSDGAVIVREDLEERIIDIARRMQERIEEQSEGKNIGLIILSIAEDQSGAEFEGRRGKTLLAPLLFFGQ